MLVVLTQRSSDDDAPLHAQWHSFSLENRKNAPTVDTTRKMIDNPTSNWLHVCVCKQNSAFVFVCQLAYTLHHAMRRVNFFIKSLYIKRGKVSVRL